MFTESGVCPECNSTDIDFGDINWNTDWIDSRIEQECRCLKCGCELRNFMMLNTVIQMLFGMELTINLRQKKRNNTTNHPPAAAIYTNILPSKIKK